MAMKCSICGIKTIFYIWTTSRNFPKHSYIKKKDIKTKHDKNEVYSNGLPVCFKCYQELISNDK